ncbi:MAG TPA: exopolysaccharide biosynthesis polyprenyl glycosylphosphotransferase [Solirubrobacteraceae bacterium]|jgi:exopolysaccharide biosynthesis polyprenyl glycosylphosphotransferase
MPEIERPARSGTHPRFERRGHRLPVAETVERPQAAIEEAAGPADVQRRERNYRFGLAVADLLAAVLALLLATDLLGGDLPTAALVALPAVVASSKLLGLYDRDDLLINKTTLDEAPQVFQLATLGALVLWLADGDLSRAQVVVLWASLLAFTLSARGLTRALMRIGVEPERCLFIGDAGSYDRLQSKFDGVAVRAELVGRMNLQRVARRGARATSEQELSDLVRWTRAQRVIIEPHTLAQDEMLDLVRAAKGIGVRVSLLPRVHDVVGSEVVFDNLQGMTLLGVRRFGLSRSSRLVKRSFDLLGAGLLTLAVAPILAVVALLIKLDSPGPVLFRQTRVGRDGRRFKIAKFRTMIADAEARKAELRAVNEAADGLFKIVDDPRITRVGRLLRKTSLDELPQLLNVLKGDMSLVGPRPLVVDEDKQITGFDRRRLSLTPGMTGHWQIAGPSRVPLAEMVKIDYLYVAGWSLWEDIKIMLRTVPYMLARRGM